MSSIATVRISSSCSPSSTSRPLTMAPTGLITSWQTREQRRAARASGVSEAIIKFLSWFGIGAWAETEPGLAALKRSDPYLSDSPPGCDDDLAMRDGCLNRQDNLQRLDRLRPGRNRR